MPISAAGQVSRYSLKSHLLYLRASLAAYECRAHVFKMNETNLSLFRERFLEACKLRDREALGGLLLAMQTAAEAPPNPWEQALWMLLADFLAAAVPILPVIPVSAQTVTNGTVRVWVG
jgi:hypothetical protein